MTVYRDSDIAGTALIARTVAVLGYGNQGRPQALNLRDSGIQVVIGLRPESPRRALATADGFVVTKPAEATAQADVVMFQVADEAMTDLYAAIAPSLRAGAFIGFCHGMAIHANLIQPRADLNVFLLAPKAQGRGVRDRYTEGSGVPALVAVHQDPAGDSLALALAYGKAIGCGRIGILSTTFAEETISNHFSEQAVLCGGLTSLVKTAFEVQIEAGIAPEVAYFGCVYELKLLADLLQQGGVTYMRERISPTARYGDLTRGPRIIDGHVAENMRQVLAEVTGPAFAAEFMADVAAGYPTMQAAMARDAAHPVEETGRQLRAAGILPQV